MDVTSWFTGKSRDTRLWQSSVPHTADLLGTDLERQARSLSDRPQAVVDLLSRWVEQSDDEQDTYQVNSCDEVGNVGDVSSKACASRQVAGTPRMALSFREALLRSRAFEAVLDTCARLPFVASVARKAAHDAQGESVGQDGAAMLRAMNDAVERWLLPGASALWPNLLNALLAGSGADDSSIKNGSLQWGPWARKVLAAVKRGWQAESLPRVLRQLDRRTSELASMRSKRATTNPGAGAGSSQLLAGGSGLSKRGIRAVLAREQLQQLSAEAADLSERVELLCIACERLREVEIGGSGRGMKLERLLEDANEVLMSLDGRAKALSSEEEVLSRSIDEIGGELQKQITGILVTQQEFTDKRAVFQEERAALVRRLEEVDSQLSQIDEAASSCDVQVRQLKEQLRGTTQHYEDKIDGTLRIQKSINAEKLRAVTYKECALLALDVVRTEKARLVSQVLVQTRRHAAELRRSLTAYLRQERLRINAIVELLESIPKNDSKGNGDAEDAVGLDVASQAEEAWESSQCLLRRSKTILESTFGERSRRSSAEGNGSEQPTEQPTSSLESGLERQALDAREYFAKEASRGQQCVDCGTHGADWASVSHGTYLCTDCAGKHRGLGVHFSFVRSTTMDRWSVRQLRRMQMGGNEQFHLFMRRYPQLHEQLRGASPAEKTILQVRYGSRAAAYYRRHLDALCDGRDCTAKAPAADEGQLQADIAAEVAVLAAEADAMAEDAADSGDEDDGAENRQASLEEEWSALEATFQKYRSVAPQKRSSTGGR